MDPEAPARVVVPGKPRRGRIAGYDVARAVAICLMILENFKVIMLGTGDDPLWLVWIAGLTDGRSAPLFVVLAGVGISLMSRRAVETNAIDALRQIRKVQLLRALFFLILGNLFILVWFMDILHFYAVYIALAAGLFLRASKRSLIVASAGIIIAATIEMVWRGEAFFQHYEYWSAWGILRDTFLDGIHPVLPWLAFVLFGMWLGRLDLSDANRRRRVLYLALAIAFGAEILSDLMQYLAFVENVAVVPQAFPQLWGTRLTPPGPLYVVSASATSAAAIALCLEIAERFPTSSHRVTQVFAAAGQLSLTLYIAHAIVGAGFLWGIEQLGTLVFGEALFWGYGTVEDHSIFFVLSYYIVYTFLSLLFAHWYRKRHVLGPLEWIMRRITGSGPKLGPSKAQTDEMCAKGAATRRGSVGVVVIVVCSAWLVAASFIGFVQPRVSCPDIEASLSRGSTFDGEMTMLCHHQWFDLHVADAGTVAIDVEAGIDTYLELFDREGREQLGEDDDSGPGYNPLMAIQLQSGHYRVLLRPYRTDTGPFTLRVR